MKALTLWQPWASALARGAKRNETRSWKTAYRGELAIHAAARRKIDELIYYASNYAWCGALGLRMGEAGALESLPFGAIVAVVTLLDCRPTETYTVGELDAPRGPSVRTDLYKWTERQMGDFSPGRFGWELGNVRALPRPVPCMGHQGLWDLTPDTLAEVQQQAGVAA